MKNVGILMIIVGSLWVFFTLFKLSTNDYKNPYSVFTYIMITVLNIIITGVFYYFAFEEHPVQVIGFIVILYVSLHRSIKSIYIIYKLKKKRLTKYS